MLVVILLFALQVTSAGAAIQTFFGEDLRDGARLPLAAYPNAAAAEADFLSNLVGVGTESFEGFAGGTRSNLLLSFPGAGTATLDLGSGEVVSLPQGQATSDGRYGISNDGGSENFLDVEAGGAGSFAITFAQPVAAFGFYGIDIGDFGGELLLQISGSDELLTVPHTATSRAEGAVLFFGFLATTVLETVTSVAFHTSTGMGDYFGFDNFTIASLDQIGSQADPPLQQPQADPGSPISANPEPASALVWGTLIGLAGTYAGRRRSRSVR
jgi:hypothetical protein